MKDYYNILNVTKSADDKTIKKAYKRLALKYHPDHNLGDKRAEEKFKEIKEAYEVLIDPKKRAMYDTEDNTEFGNIFSEVFGDIFRKTKDGDTLKYFVELSLEEAVHGVKKDLKIFVFKPCLKCYATGNKDGRRPITCLKCRGRGTVEQLIQGFFTIQQTCPSCHGEGEVLKHPCDLCKGEGRVRQNKTLYVTFPAGIENNHQMKLSGEGDAGRRGGRNGNILITIKIKDHAIFKRKNNDLYCKIPISFITAALGGEIEVPTFNNKIKVKIPAETQTDKILRIKGKGVQSVNNPSSRGDLFCKLIVEVPINLNEKQKYLLKELEATGIYFPQMKKV